MFKYLIILLLRLSFAKLRRAKQGSPTSFHFAQTVGVNFSPFRRNKKATVVAFLLLRQDSNRAER